MVLCPATDCGFTLEQGLTQELGYVICARASYVPPYAHFDLATHSRYLNQTHNFTAQPARTTSTTTIMETLSNLASAATNTASKLIYGDQTKPEDQATTATNETAGKEPLSGEQGKGTVAEPFDQGNAGTKTSSEAYT